MEGTIPSGYQFHFIGEVIPDGWKRREDLEFVYRMPESSVTLHAAGIKIIEKI